jgi:hypothetical protein
VTRGAIFSARRIRIFDAWRQRPAPGAEDPRPALCADLSRCGCGGKVSLVVETIIVPETRRGQKIRAANVRARSAPHQPRRRSRPGSPRQHFRSFVVVIERCDRVFTTFLQARGRPLSYVRGSDSFMQTPYGTRWRRGDPANDVQEDIRILERHGLVKITQRPRGSRKIKGPEVPFEEIALHIAI